MRVDVLINPRAGYANAQDLKDGIHKALFRCELHFHLPANLHQLADVVEEVSKARSSYLVVCGGDGTLNATLQPLMRIRQDREEYVPSLCVIPVGTANDLARDIQISNKIEKAAHAILSGDTKVVDILQISANGHSAYMFTNGGLGVPARTARQANVIRRFIKRRAQSEATPAYLKPVFAGAMKLVELAGSKVYDLILLNEVVHWDSSDWDVEISVPGQANFTTKAPFIMVNNQPTLGKGFKPAPFTSNTDGKFNVLLVQPTKLLAQARVLLDIRRGRLPQIGKCLGFETPVITFRAQNPQRPFTFFGDGEILHRGVRELTVRCIHPGLPIVTTGCMQ